MVARCKYSTAALPKPSNPLTVVCGKAVTGINCEEPQFIEVQKVQLTQEGVVASGISLAITYHHVNERIAICVLSELRYSRNRKSVRLSNRFPPAE